MCVYLHGHPSNFKAPCCIQGPGASRRFRHNLSLTSADIPPERSADRFGLLLTDLLRLLEFAAVASGNHAFFSMFHFSPAVAQLTVFQLFSPPCSLCSCPPVPVRNKPSLSHCPLCLTVLGMFSPKSPPGCYVWKKGAELINFMMIIIRLKLGNALIGFVWGSETSRLITSVW